MKRFWTTAAAAAAEGGFGVSLDGKPVRLPGAGVLTLPTEALARAVADEWDRAGADTGRFTAADTPLTGLAGTAQARIAPDPGPTRDALAAYGGSDVVCYFADEPESLVARQHQAWDPWLAYAADRLDAPLRATRGIGYVDQDPRSLDRLRRALDAADPYALAGLGVIVPALGSLVLGLAVWAGDLDAAAAVAVATVDERVQAERWGADALAAARAGLLRADVLEAARFIACARAPIAGGRAGQT